MNGGQPRIGENIREVFGNIRLSPPEIQAEEVSGAPDLLCYGRHRCLGGAFPLESVQPVPEPFPSPLVLYCGDAKIPF